MKTNSSIPDLVVRKLSSIFETISNSFIDERPYTHIIVKGKALFLFDIDNKFRLQIVKLVTNWKFEAFIMLCIVYTMILLAIDIPSLAKQSTTKQFIDISNFIMTIIFLIEMMLKSIAMGFIANKYSYLKDHWNKLDFIIVVISVLDWIPSISSTYFIGLRAARALRPLRIVNSFRTLRIVITAMINSLPGILNVVLVSSFFFLLFATLGVSIFNGQFYQCEQDITLDQLQCLSQGYSWSNPSYGNFDTIFDALLVLKEVSSLEMWPTILYRAVDINGIGNAPLRDKHQILALYFIIFLIITSFLIQLISGVVVDNFQDIFLELRQQAKKKKKKKMEKNQKKNQKKKKKKKKKKRKFLEKKKKKKKKKNQIKTIEIKKVHHPNKYI